MSTLSDANSGGMISLGLGLSSIAENLAKGEQDRRTAESAEEKQRYNREIARDEAEIRKLELAEMQYKHSSGGMQAEQDAMQAKFAEQEARFKSLEQSYTRDATIRALRLYEKNNNPDHFFNLFRNHKKVKTGILGEGAVITNVDQLDYDDPKNAGMVNQVVYTLGDQATQAHRGIPEGTERLQHLGQKPVTESEEQAGPVREGEAGIYTINKDNFKKRFIKITYTKDGEAHTEVRDIRDLMSGINYTADLSQEETRDTMANLMVLDKKADVAIKQSKLKPEAEAQKSQLIDAVLSGKEPLSQENVSIITEGIPRGDKQRSVWNRLRARQVLHDKGTMNQEVSETKDLEEQKAKETILANSRIKDEKNVLNKFTAMTSLGATASGLNKDTTGVATIFWKGVEQTLKDDTDISQDEITTARNQYSVAIVNSISGTAVSDKEFARVSTSMGLMKGLNTSLTAFKNSLKAQQEKISAIRKQDPEAFHLTFGTSYNKLRRTVHGLENRIEYIKNDQRRKKGKITAKELKQRHDATRANKYVDYEYNRLDGSSASVVPTPVDVVESKPAPANLKQVAPKKEAPISRGK